MIEYLTSIFVIPCSIFDIRFFRVSFSIRLAVFLARGDARMKLAKGVVSFLIKLAAFQAGGGADTRNL